MGKIRDLTGKQFSSWLVLEIAEKIKGGTYWRCQCECGTIKDVYGCNLTQGKSKSCGCKSAVNTSQRNTLDLTGQVFGRLTVLKRDRAINQGRVMWICQCECGRQKAIRTTHLRSGASTSCGCYAFEQASMRRGKIAHAYKTGKTKNKAGYVVLTGHWEHPNSNKRGVILEHVQVMSIMLGRPLRDGENVHHKNGIRDDNRPENLELWVNSQPPGQRVEDRINDAVNFLMLYAPEKLAHSIERLV